MLHFKQLSNSSAPPPRRKTSLPQIIKTLKIVKYRALTGVEGQTSTIKSTVCLSHLFCITPLPYPISRIPEFPPTTHPATRLSSGTCASPSLICSQRGKLCMQSSILVGFGFGGLFTFSDFQSLHEDSPPGEALTLDRLWAELDRQVESSLVCRNQPRLAVTLFLGTVNNLMSVTSVMFLQHLCLLVELP